MTYVLFHSGCYDGVAAAFCAWKKFGDKAKYIGVRHNEPPPEIADGSDVFILDFAYPKDILVLLSQRTNLVVLDHHISAQRDLEGLSFAHFDMNKSGCILAWEYFYPSRPIPLILQYMSDRDLWKFKMRGTEEVFAAVQSYDCLFKFECWNNWVTNERTCIDELKFEGKLIVRFKNQVVKSICRNAYPEIIDGHKATVCTCTSFWSEVGHTLLIKAPDAEISASWYRTKDDKEKWQLRSRENGVDVSEVAKKYGGGGHKTAAGFILPWNGARLPITPLTST